jgi:cytochrome oxidase Cu insertion factor (SCO1/SenC/PrrC family)
MPRRFILYFSAALLILAVAIGSYSLLMRAPPGSSGSGEALVGGPFSLTDQTGKRVSEKDFLGRYMLVFFGYTYCPDVCPTELQVMMAALASMGEQAARIQPVFVSIDPERDTPSVLKSYVENFGPQLIGLTGSAEEIASVAKAYRVYYAKAGKGGSDYLMDHSSVIYLMGPDGRFVKHFTYTTDAAALAAALKETLTTSP